MQRNRERWKNPRIAYIGSVCALGLGSALPLSMHRARSHAANSDLIQDLYDALNRRDFQDLRARLDDGCTWLHAERREQIEGGDAVLAKLASFVETFPEIVIELRRVHHAGSTAIVEWSVATTRGTQRREPAIVCEVLELRDGRVVRGTTYGDALMRIIELGAAPEPELETEVIRVELPRMIA